MKRILGGLFLLFCLSAFAGPLPTNHFLYPRDWEPLWLLDIERGLSFGAAIRNLQNCEHPERLTTPFRVFHCDLFQNTEQIDPLVPTFDDKNFGTLTIFGETHTNVSGQDFVAQVIKESPQGFFQVLALEMFNSSGQEDIDELVAKKATRAEWRVLFEKHWSYFAEGYLDIIESALEKDMKILALDNRRKENGGDHSDDFSKDMIFRDRHMAQVLENQLHENPNQRIVFVTGKLHGLKTLGESPITITEILKERFEGITSRHYLLFDNKKTVLFRSLKPNASYPIRYKLNGISKSYADDIYVF